MERYTDIEVVRKKFFPCLTEQQYEKCYSSMQPRFIEYIPGQSLTIAFPVLDEYLNPYKKMQGGFITAAFDNVFGAFCLCETKGQPIATIDINTNYHRPVFQGDEITITVKTKFAGKTIVYMDGEARNKEKKLVASSNTNIMLLSK